MGELVAIVAILATAGVIVNLVRYRNERLALHTGGAGSDDAAARENARLALENEGLRLTVEQLEGRMAVLERIATDPAERTAREIERLR